MKKMDLVVGQKIRGYGLLNEFGEFDFIPEQKGARQGEIKLIKSNDDYTISETKKKILVHFRLEKGQGSLDLIKTFFKVVNLVIKDFRDYEF